MDCSIPGFLVHHQLPELAQTHVQGGGGCGAHWVGGELELKGDLLEGDLLVSDL